MSNASVDQRPMFTTPPEGCATQRYEQAFEEDGAEAAAGAIERWVDTRTDSVVTYRCVGGCTLALIDGGLSGACHERGSPDL